MERRVIKCRIDLIRHGPSGRATFPRGEGLFLSFVGPLPSPMGKVDRRSRDGRGPRSFPAFPFGGRRPSELYERQVASAQQMTEEAVPLVKGGLPARTIERARLTAMWAAGEVPGSEGKPPKRLRPSFPFTEWKRFTRNPRQKSNVPCRDGDFWRFAFQTRTAARAHIAVALPCPNGLRRQTAVTGGAPPPQAVPLPTAVGRLLGDRIATSLRSSQ